MVNFEIGELVYHKTLGVFGIFNGSSIDDSCHFDYKDEYNFDEYNRVSIDKLEKSKFNIGDRVKCIKTVRDSCVLKMRIGQIGTIENIYYKYIIVKTNNGELVKCTIDKLELYIKEEKFNIKTCTSEELIDRFHKLVQDECCSKTTQTTTYKKLLNDLEKYRSELLNRLNG